MAKTTEEVLTLSPPREGFAIDELRLLVRNANDCNETFNQRFSVLELIQIHRMWHASDWDTYPDTWTEQQVQEALQGNVPKWNDETGAAIHEPNQDIKFQAACSEVEEILLADGEPEGPCNPFAIIARAIRLARAGKYPITFPTDVNDVITNTLYEVLVKHCRLDKE